MLSRGVVQIKMINGRAYFAKKSFQAIQHIPYAQKVLLSFLCGFLVHGDTSNILTLPNAHDIISKVEKL